MFDINTIKNLKCLICRQNLVELEDREDNKCLTKKDYKRYLRLKLNYKNWLCSIQIKY